MAAGPWGTTRLLSCSGSWESARPMQTGPRLPKDEDSSYSSPWARPIESVCPVHTCNIHTLPPPPVLKNPNPVISALYTLDTSNTRRLRKRGARDEQKGTTPYLAGIPTQLSNHLVPSWHLTLSAGKERDPRPTGTPGWYSRTSQGQEEAETTCHPGHQRPLFPLTAEASAAVSTQLTRGQRRLL